MIRQTITHNKTLEGATENESRRIELSGKYRYHHLTPA